VNALTEKMPHLEALGLNFNPFPVVPDAHNYFMTDRMSCSISDILHCIDARKGFILISGEVGLGKTTLSRLLLFKLAQRKINTALVFNTFLQEKSLLKAINKDFNIFIVSDKLEDQLDALNRFLLNQYARNKNCVIVIDDAQQLSIKSLELIRQLSNLETNQNKLVQIILVAQGEILQTLNREDLRQLKSRIALNIKIEPLSLPEVRQYVDFRLARAGASGQIRLEGKASKYLHKVTHGLPRQINLVLDRCLYVVAAYDKNVIDRNLVMQAFQEISINPEEKQRPLLSIYAIVILFGSLLGMAIYNNPFLINDKAEIIKTTESSDSETIKKSVVVKQETQSNEANLSTQSIVYYPEKQKKPLVKFLSSFNFGKSYESIFSAIEAHDLTMLAEKVNQLTTYKLLITPKLGALEEKQSFWGSVDENQKDIWLTFWKPEITIEAFYQGYYSDSIYQLQSRLSNLGYYHFNVDGIVGEKTLTGITKLQKEYGIDASGFPNDLTLYFLQRNNTKPSSSGEYKFLSDKYNKKKTSNLKSESYQLKNIVSNEFAFDDSSDNTLTIDNE
jgi:general secretion pathway protein A